MALLLFHIRYEFIEQNIRILRTAARFGMELHCKCVYIVIFHAFAGIVVDVYKADFPFFDR